MVTSYDGHASWQRRNAGIAAAASESVDSENHTNYGRSRHIELRILSLYNSKLNPKQVSTLGLSLGDDSRGRVPERAERRPCKLLII
jgi:hypothetical protein